MPFYHRPRNFIPLSIAAEKKSIKNGLHHSIFTSRFDRYVGEWKKDLKEGKGVFLTISGKFNRLPNGTFRLEYRGEWVKGKPEGAGWRHYENGDVYFGFWKRGHRHGYGKMYYVNGTIYVGYWNKSLREGLGMIIQENGNRYEGHWMRDMKNGLGRFYHMHTGQLQEGCWVNNICILSKMSDIEIRQFCDMPSEYPIPEETLANPRCILEESVTWLQQKIGNIDKQLKFCIDQM
ncbi:unnamed protein product [Leptidea sinapis]|uniref:MORN repeat-containing protein 3 n=1 Tax=Leptidea sinapis TaxID=189913 RepID=A0A5E4R3C5_9NEOP|nr:unnamed protein product [Leptidea sinapis]